MTSGRGICRLNLKYKNSFVVVAIKNAFSESIFINISFASKIAMSELAFLQMFPCISF